MSTFDLTSASFHPVCFKWKKKSLKIEIEGRDLPRIQHGDWLSSGLMCPLEQI